MSEIVHKSDFEIRFSHVLVIGSDKTPGFLPALENLGKAGKMTIFSSQGNLKKWKKILEKSGNFVTGKK